MELERFHMGGETMEIVDAGARELIENLPPVPTKTSQLTNDSGFITNANIPTKTSQLTNDSGFITDADVPTKTSELTNDSGFITSAALPTKTSDLTNDSGFITSAAVPTKTSELTNDSGFITSSSREATVNSGWIRTAIPTSDGVKYKYDGQFTATYNFNTLYGGGYLADFSLTIPAAIRPPVNFYDVQVTALASGKIVIPALNTANKSTIAGWLWGPAGQESKSVTIHVSAYGY